PVLLGPDWYLVGPDRQDVELTALGSDIGSDALAQHVLLQRDPLNRNVRVLSSESACQTLHADHIAVVHRRNGERGLGERRDGGEKKYRPRKSAVAMIHGLLPGIARGL